MADRKSPAAKTELTFGLVRVPVALLKTTEEPKDAKYETAGPNGHPLKTETRLFRGDEMIADEERDEALYRPEADVLRSDDPDPGPEAPPASDPIDPDAAAAAFADAAGLNAVEQRNVLVEDETGVIVAKEDVRRGLRQPDGSFLDLTDGLAEIDDATQLDRMGVVAFIDVGQVPRELVRGSHYLCADAPDATRALKFLYDGMRETRRAAVVKWTKRTKQALGVIVPQGRTGAMVVLEMAWPNHVRAVESDPRILAHTGFETQDHVLKAVTDLIDAMSVTAEGSFAQQRDDREILRAQLLAAAEAGQEWHVVPEPEPANAEAKVEDLAVESGERRAELAKAA